MVVCCCGEGGRDADDESWLLLFRGMKERGAPKRETSKSEWEVNQQQGERGVSQLWDHTARGGVQVVESGDGGSGW